MKITTLYAFTDMNYHPDIKPYIRKYFKYNHRLKCYSYIKRNNWTGLGFRRKKLTSIIKRCERLREDALTKICAHYDSEYTEILQVGRTAKGTSVLVLISNNGDDYD